jgi:hypothetical protein
VRDLLILIIVSGTCCPLCISWLELFAFSQVSLQHDHPELLALLLNPEIVQLQQDPGCVQASLARLQGQGQIWAKPLAAATDADGTTNGHPHAYGPDADLAAAVPAAERESFAVGLLNLGDTPANLTICWTNQPAVPFAPSHPCYERMLGGPGAKRSQLRFRFPCGFVS